MNNLERFFENYKSDEGRATYKHKNYQQIYEDSLLKFVGNPTTLVELGIGYGGSLQMWRSYLGEHAQIIGIDKHDQLCYEDERIHCITSEESSISSIGLPPMDVFIDDGSHICANQIRTFETVFPMLNLGGIYFCEDVHTSYRDEYGGGYRKSGSFIEYAKNLIDGLHSQESELIESPSFMNSIKSITFFRTLVMVEK